jgi:predicted DNA-binding transcriptional regulator AlpA
MEPRPLKYAVIAPRGLGREDAASYIGISPSKFDQMVADRRMPEPRRIDTRKVWDVRELDKAFEALPGGQEVSNPWDELL